MDREQVARTLEEIGLLLELLGENPFKTRAYENGARVIRGLDGDLREMALRKELTRVRGIGPALAEKIGTLVVEGHLPYLQQLHEQVPPGLLDWLKIPGVGAKKARAIHIALGISTLAELESACEQDRLRELPGFGQLSQDKILRGIGRLEQRAGRFLRSVVQPEADRLLALLRGASGVVRAEVGGSVRRKLETSKDIDFVVAAEDAESVMDAFAAADGVTEVTGRGPTKCSVRSAQGPLADLRVVSAESFPFALMYFTGSKAHNIALRARAQQRGCKLNEYALVREADGRPIPCADEEAIYHELGIGQWIPPELREDQGELEAATERTLPVLLEESDLQGVLHVHSEWSDGAGSIADLADAARAMGLRYVGICDHSRAAAFAGGLDEEQVRRQWAEIDLLNMRHSGSFRILKGTEVDILTDGSLDFPDEVLAGFDLVIAAVHSGFGLSEEEQTRRLLKALDNPYVDILGHVTGRQLLSRDGYPLDLHRVLDAATRRGVAVEVNSHPRRLDPDWQSLRHGLRLGLKTSINPDAHDRGALKHMSFGVDHARKAWCTRESVLNAWPLDRLLEHVESRRRSAGVAH